MIKSYKNLRMWQAPKIGVAGVNLIGPAEYLFGLGTSVRGYAASLMRSHVPLNVIPWRSGFEHLKSISVGYPSRELQPINLIHLNLDFLAIDRPLDSAPLNKIATADRYNICIPYLELTALKPEWLEIINRFDEVWCATTFIARAISAVSARPVHVIRPALSWFQPTSQRSRNGFGLPADKFVFFFAADAGSVFGRKNPRLFVDAYVQTFEPDEGACCLVKINRAKSDHLDIKYIQSIAQQRPDVIFMMESLDNADMSALYNQIDCYVSPHRSEGLGLTILEAMSAGKPVIATPFGGAADFVTPDIAIPLDYRLVEVGEGNAPYPPSYIWADPNPASLCHAMRYLFQHPDEARAMGQRGKTYAEDLFSPERTACDIQDAISRIWQAGGGQIETAHQDARNFDLSQT